MKMYGLFKVGAVVTALVGASAALAQEYTLTVHDFVPSVANSHKVMLVPWTERVTEQSDGRIAFEIFPAMSMGGRPNELYSQVRDGAADIVMTLLGYTPGVFPRTEVFELPTVHGGSATATTIALNAMFDDLAADFEDVHVLFLFANDGNLIHSATKPINTFEDLAGMKLRTPGRTGAWTIEAMGAEPVALPVPALPEAMSKGVVDGALTTYEIVPALRLQELEKYTAELPDGDRFGAAVFMLAMNKDVYESMPDDLKAVLDANSRNKVAKEVGTMWEDFEAGGIKALADAGVTSIVFSEEEAAKFRAANETVVQRWINEVSSQGIDGQALVDKARAAIAAASE